MLKRKIAERLLEWKRTKQKRGLLITGARQIGKTSSIEAFAAEHYSNVIKIDFVARPEAVRLTSEATSLEDLIVRITALATRPIPDGKTLLFFDGIQRCGDVLTWMRYLAQDERFDVVYSGSLLGAEVYDFRSLPVGTLDVVEMFPLDFEEFSWALGADQSLWEIVRDCCEHAREVPDFIHDRFMMQKYFTKGRSGKNIEFVGIHYDAGNRTVEEVYQWWQNRAASERYQVEDGGHLQVLRPRTPRVAEER